MTSFGRRTSVIIAVGVGKIMMFNYPGQRTILCIDDDDGMLCYEKALFAVLTEGHRWPVTLQEPLLRPFRHWP
ncbi:MAG: hypothetical protein ACXWBP_13710 [Limisphaerales bacterium]